MNDPEVIYIGFYGLFAITFISVVSSFFVPHNYVHNILLHIIGVLFLFLLELQIKNLYKNDFFYLGCSIFRFINIKDA